MESRKVLDEEPGLSLTLVMVNLVTGGGFYVMKDGQRNFNEPVETVYPVSFDRSQNRLYLLNMAR
jgi:hypothetical protein